MKCRFSYTRQLVPKHYLFSLLGQCDSAALCVFGGGWMDVGEQVFLFESAS